MPYDSKIALVVRDDLQPWQALNVTAFLAGGLVGANPELSGAPYQDGSGGLYGPLIRQPILIFAASGPELTRTLVRSKERGLRCSIYTSDHFQTGNDADNRAAVARVEGHAIDLVGLALHAERKEGTRS